MNHRAGRAVSRPDEAAAAAAAASAEIAEAAAAVRVRCDVSMFIADGVALRARVFPSPWCSVVVWNSCSADVLRQRYFVARSICILFFGRGVARGKIGQV